MKNQSFPKASIIKSWLGKIPEAQLNRLIGLLLIAVSYSVAWFMMDYQDFTETGMALPEGGIVYEIKPGNSINSVANDFEKKGWINNNLYLRLQAKLEDIAIIKTGEYRLSEGMLALDALKLFSQGKAILHQISFIEGWTFKQMRQSLQQHPAVKQTLSKLDEAEILQRLGDTYEKAEGLFLADTYNFRRDTSDFKILQQARQAMKSALAREWQRRDDNLPFKTPYEALILASIVEKETAQASERPLIARVFISRLQKNMKLQTDPTVIYGMGDDYKGNIRRKDLRKDTPYNTYVHFGLTPTPICMPGIDAIKAVLHPVKSDYLYFVARGDGTHYFSRTLAEHNRAVRKYQLKRKKRK